MDYLTLKHHSRFQNRNKKKATPMFAPRHLFFKLQHEVLNFSDICVG